MAKSVKAFEAAAAVLARHASRLMRRRGVTGVDVGYRLRNGQYTDEVAIRIHVAMKLSETLLPKRLLLPKDIEGVPVDVIRRQYIARQGGANVGPLASCEPVRPGCAIAPQHNRDEWGTLGLVVHAPNGLPAYLTAAHVVIGSAPQLGAAPEMVQPPLGAVLPAIGTAPLASIVLRPRIDCALITPDLARPHLTDVIGIAPPYRAGRLEWRDVAARTRVSKSGAATDVTTGIVESVSARVDIPGQRTFFDQITIREENGRDFVRGGDSGSAIIKTETNEVVGLVHAGTTDGVGVACHFVDVASALGISLV